MPAALDAPLSGDLRITRDDARSLQEAGLSGAFTYEGKTDPFLPVAVAADDFGGMLYTNIAVAFPRSPMHTALQAWDLQRQTGGRFALGLGTQIKAHIERRYGSVWDAPLAQMRESIAATKAIFAAWQDGTPLAFEGRWTRHTLMPPLLTPDPLDTPAPPVWLAALGPRMTALAGEAADGLLVHPFTSRRHVAEANLPNLEVGLRAAGRDRSDVTTVIGVIVGLHETDEEADRAQAAVRGMLGFYGSTPAYRPVLDAHGWGELQPELRALTKANRWGELGARYDDEQVATLAVVGTPQTVATELHARFGDLADRLALSLPGPRRPELLAALTEAYAAG